MSGKATPRDVYILCIPLSVVIVRSMSQTLSVNCKGELFTQFLSVFKRLRGSPTI